MKYKIRYFIIFLILIISISFLIPGNLSAELKQFWVDTSHWETTGEWISEGHWETNSGRGWIDTSYWVSDGYWDNYTETVWIDTSHWVERGYWQNYTYNEWVTSGYYNYKYVNRWVDTSHWETRYRTISTWVSCNKVFYYGTSSYGWNVYAFAAKYKGTYQGTINGTRYKYHKYVIDYRPSYGGRVYAIKYVCYQQLTEVVSSYNVWVSSGYWDTVREWYWIDTSHWETKTGRRWVDDSYWLEEGHYETRSGSRWVDTSYLVSQGHWENYTETVWIDTSRWEYEDTWVEEGHWAEADINLEGRVLHTLKWDKNRINYNLSKTGTTESPRGYEIFFNGEKFILNAYVAGEFEPDSIAVEFIGSGFDSELTGSDGGKWEGEIWDSTFINFHDRICLFRFTANYGNGIVLEDDVGVYIVRDGYWRLHRGF